MSFVLQVKTRKNVEENSVPVWVSVGPADSNKIYEYPTEAEAFGMLSMCYPDQLRAGKFGGGPTVRVVEIKSVTFRKVP